MTKTLRLPTPSPFGVGPVFEVVLPVDVTTLHGNVQATAGRYEAQQSVGSPEGVISIWSPDHYTGSGCWVSIAAQDWTFPGEPQRPVPSHDCSDPDNWKSGVAGGVFCRWCKTRVQ